MKECVTEGSKGQRKERWSVFVLCGCVKETLGELSDLRMIHWLVLLTSSYIPLHPTKGSVALPGPEFIHTMRLIHNILKREHMPKCTISLWAKWQENRYNTNYSRLPVSRREFRWERDTNMWFLSYGSPSIIQWQMTGLQVKNGYWSFSSHGP